MVITWNNVPDYDQWGFDSKWSCEQWIEWHRALKTHFGPDRAKLIWDYAFAQSGNLSENLNCRTFNGSFRSYVAANKLDPMANAGIFTPVLNGLGSAQDIADNIFDSLSSLTKSNTLKNIIVIAGFAVVVFGGAYLYKTFKPATS